MCYVGINFEFTDFIRIFFYKKLRGKMNVLYKLLFFVLMLGLAYVVGMRMGNEKCQMKHARNVAQQQLKIIEIQRNVNEITTDHSDDDIRRILREKYTIAE